MRASDALERAGMQMAAVAPLLGVGTIGAVKGDRWGLSVALSAGVVLVALSVLAVVRMQDRRDRVIDLIVEAGDVSALTAVHGQIRRMGGSRNRRALARTIEALIEEAAHPQIRSARPPLDRTVIRTVQGDLRVLARLLRAEHASVRGVASVDRLLKRVLDSPLYGHDAAALREELRRTRHLLEGS